MIKKSLIKCMTLIAICSLLFAGCGKKSKTTTVEASRENSTVTEKETRPSVAGMEVTDSFGNSVDVAGELVTNAIGEKRVVITDRDGNKTEIPATGFSESGNTVTITDSTVAGEISSAAAENKIPGADEVAVVPSDKKEEGGSGSNPGGDSSGNSGSNGSDNGSSGSNSGSSSSGSSGDSGSSQTPPSAPAHEHSWEAVYTTVHHDAVTHEEQRWVVDKEAWEEPVKRYVEICRHCKDGTCKRCAALGLTQYEFDTIQEFYKHQDACLDEDGSCFSSTYREVIDHYIHHDEEGHYEIYTVVDKDAYDEQVVTGYKCSCGETK